MALEGGAGSAEGSFESAETLKRSRIWSVCMDWRPAFCWLTTVEATSILNRWRLRRECEHICKEHAEGVYVLQNLFLQGTARNDAVDVDYLLLTDTMRAVHGLNVLLRVPVMLDEDDRISTSQVESETTNTGCQEQDVI